MAAPHPLSDVDLRAAKAALRASARARRAALNPALGARLADAFLSLVPLPAGAAVAGTWPIAGEMDLRPLWIVLHERGHSILLPQTPRRPGPLIFRLWSPGAAMLAEPFGTMHPDGPAAVPGLIVVPFLAFDAACHRLGYGGGYYDRTLAALPDVPAIGAGFAALQVPDVPAGPHDRPLAMIVTEHGIAARRQAG